MSVLEAETAELPPEIAAALGAHDPAIRAVLLRLRALILETAQATEGVGPLAESLKWGQPSYTPKKPRVGSSVRLDTTKAGDPALFFICHTGLVDRFREHYGDALTFEGNRAIVLDPDAELPLDKLRHCIALALTWHLRR